MAVSMNDSQLLLDFLKSRPNTSLSLIKELLITSTDYDNNNQNAFFRNCLRLLIIHAEGSLKILPNKAAKAS
jgi:hypothetical protein